jgi:hypothetical protein
MGGVNLFSLTFKMEGETHAFPLNDIRKKSSKNELFYSILARNLKLHGHLEMVLLLAKIKKKSISQLAIYVNA